MLISFCDEIYLFLFLDLFVQKLSFTKLQNKKTISSSLELFCKQGVLKKIPKFKRKHLCWSIYLIKFWVSNLKIIKKETPTQVFRLCHMKKKQAWGTLHALTLIFLCYIVNVFTKHFKCHLEMAV